MSHRHMEDNRTNALVGINSNSYALSGKVMLVSIIVVFSVVIFIACFHFYARRSHRRHLHRQRQRHLIFNSNSSTTTGANPSKGLDFSVLKSLPTFLYSSNTQNPLLDCAVCLSEFEDNEMGRLLPKCNHCFHVQCIDMWLQSHSSCPLCRAPVQPLVSFITTETALSIDEHAGSEGTNRNFGLYQLGRMSNSTSSPALASFPSEERERKPLELVGISVEVPSMDERFKHLAETGSGGARGHGIKSPGGRVLSLKRIWSI